MARKPKSDKLYFAPIQETSICVVCAKDTPHIYHGKRYCKAHHPAPDLNGYPIFVSSRLWRTS